MWSALSAFALLAPVAHALLRFPCSEFTVTRSDPLVTPGKVSGHLHQVVGGDAFDFQMADGMDVGATAKCSTCSIKENKSNYWTADLYFQHPTNKSFQRVTRSTGPLLGSPTNGGIVVYYIQKQGQNTAFPKGFRMLAGDAMMRQYNSSYDDHRSILYRCLQSDMSTGTETSGFPTTKCPGGIRTQINFPTCWDGKNLDSANHKSHVAYATGSSFYNFGTGCPSTHPVQMPILYLETYWNTQAFDQYWSGGSNPFVWSMGDPTGYGYHADYVMGWEGDSLVNAMAKCTDQGGAVSSCSSITTRSESDMNNCAVPNRVDEPIDNWLPALPGCNPIQAGPGKATTPSTCSAPSEMIPKDKASWLKDDITGWTPVGCGAENTNENILGGARTTMTDLTVEKCLNYCNTQKATYAGVKNGNQCSCGTTVDTSKFNSQYVCNLACVGNNDEYCGTSNRIAVYSGNGTVVIPTNTAAPPTSPSSTPAPAPAPPGSIPKYGQCGGQGWTGSGSCASGSTCVAQNQWYSQCV